MSALGPGRRVWSAVTVEPRGSGFSVLLDGRPVFTPARAILLLPRRAIAEAVATEWSAQGETVNPDTLPLTRLANTAQDRVAGSEAAVIGEIVGYGATDLLCYRAPHPASLAARQADAWDAPLAWARSRYGAALVCAVGLMHVTQPPESLSRLRQAVEACAAEQGPLGLVALAELVALSGSLVLGLAVAEGAAGAGDAWAASRIDETFQAEQWGEDAEAAALAGRREAAFQRAAWLSATLRDDQTVSARP
jgi:chaperone required for assembly of F1-ATPase